MGKFDMTGFDVAAALGLLTRLPVRLDGKRAADRGARAAWAYPLVGLVVGVIAGVAGGAALWLGLPVPLAAALMLATAAVITGAMHEDGLADCADGFWGGWDKTRRLEIMKDSQIGTYGVLALVLSVLLRWAALVALIEAGFLWMAVLVPALVSRAVMVWVMAALPLARSSGLSRSVGQPDMQVAAVACLLALIGTALAAPVVPVVLAAGLAGLAVMTVAKAKIGGQTGDVLGATQQVSEIAVLLALVAVV